MSCTAEPVIQLCDTGQHIPYFDSCQLTIAWMPSIYCGLIATMQCDISHPLKWGTYVRTILSNQNFLDEKITKFYHPWLSAINKYLQLR